jgi:hypothetical protein
MVLKSLAKFRCWVEFKNSGIDAHEIATLAYKMPRFVTSSLLSSLTTLLPKKNCHLLLQCLSFLSFPKYNDTRSMNFSWPQKRNLTGPCGVCFQNTSCYYMWKIGDQKLK